MPSEPTSSNARFPTTRQSAAVGLGSDDEAVRARSFVTFALGYYKPVYKHVRVKWNKRPEDAKDVTQAFFAAALKEGFLKGYDKGRGRFRTWVRVCLDGFVSKLRRAEKRKKRGGDKVLESLDFGAAEAEIAAFPPGEGPVDAYFDREWARHVFGAALDGLRAQCEAKGLMVRFRVFERYEIAGQRAEKPTYEAVGLELGIPATHVNNHLHRAREELRCLVLETLRDLLPNAEELRIEARALLGVELSEEGSIVKPPRTPAKQHKES
jgi:RNA polymerase sigma factor (sigma-70 family)